MLGSYPKKILTWENFNVNSFVIIGVSWQPPNTKRDIHRNELKITKTYVHEIKHEKDTENDYDSQKYHVNET